MTSNRRRQLLDGLLVLEMARSVRAAYCGKLLADRGAQVIKVEPPDEGTRLTAGERAWLDAGKQSVALDWHGAGAAALLLRLAARADALVEDQEPGALIDAGLSHDALAEANRRLVHTTITDFGADGPWVGRPATDLIVSALSGMASLNNFSGRVPLREPGDQTSLLGAMFGFMGTMAALLNRHVTGRGQQVDISAMEAVASVLTPQFLHHSYKGAPYSQRAPESDTLLRCKDGWISLTPHPDRAWDTLTAIYSLAIDPGDPRFASESARRENAAAVRAALAPVLSTRTRREVFEELCTLRVVCGMVMRPDELPDDPHLGERGSFLRQPCAGDGDDAVVLPGPAFRIADERPEALPPPPDASVDVEAMLARMEAVTGASERHKEYER